MSKNIETLSIVTWRKTNIF